MKFIKTFENFNEEEFETNDMGSEFDRDNDYENEMMPPHNMEEDDDVHGFGMGEEFDEEDRESVRDRVMAKRRTRESEMSMKRPFEMDGGMEEFEEEEEEVMPTNHDGGSGHIMSFREAKKAKPDFLDLDKDGNKKESMKKAAADKKKSESPKRGSKSKNSPKGSKLSKSQEKLPEALKKAIRAGVKD